MSGSVVVVVPAYNEAHTIAPVVERAARHADRLIVVDDGSSDATAACAVAVPGVEVVRHGENRGKAASLRTGMDRALATGAGVVITLDGDGQHDPDDIVRLLDAAATLPDHVIIAARLADRGTAPALRRFANRFADFWISWAAAHWIEDTQSGFRLFPAAVLRRVLPGCGRYRRFVFESLMLIEAAGHGFRTTSVPVRTVYPPDARPSHYRATLDTCLIVRAVAWRLIRRGMAPLALCRALGWLPQAYPARRPGAERSDGTAGPGPAMPGLDTSTAPQRNRWKA